MTIRFTSFYYRTVTRFFLGLLMMALWLGSLPVNANNRTLIYPSSSLLLSNNGQRVVVNDNNGREGNALFDVFLITGGNESDSTNLDGQPRNQGSGIDLGALELRGVGPGGPAITRGPLGSPLACVGGTVLASVTATGATSYQWLKNGLSLGAAQTTSVLAIPNAQLTDSGNYQVVVSDGATSVTSTALSVTVNTAAGITVQPVATSVVCRGATVTAFLSATGAVSGYQWYKGTTAISTQRSATLTLTNVQPGDTDGYTGEIIASCGRVFTSVFSLTVRQDIGFTQQPAARSVVCAGGTVTIGASVSGSGPFGYQWIKGVNNIPGQTSPTLTLTNVQPNDTDGYTLLAFDLCSNAIFSNTFNLTVNAPVGITVQPVTTSVVCQGSTITASISVSGTGPFTYEWIKGITPIASQTTATLSLTNVQPGNTDSYVVRAITPCNNVLSNPFNVTVNATTQLITQPIPSLSVCVCSPVVASVSATGSGLLSYQWFKNGAALNSQRAAMLHIGSAMVTDAGNYSVVVTGTCGSVTSTAFSLSVNGSLIGITTQPVAPAVVCVSDNVTVSTSVTGTVSSYQWYKNGTSMGASQQTSTLTLSNAQIANSGNYFLVATGDCNSVTSTAFGITVNTPTSILTQPPAASTVCAGATVLARVSVSGAGAFTYRWYKDGTLVNGQTTATLTLLNVQPTDAGSYVVEVTGCGSVTSTPFSLTTGTAKPTITITFPGNSSLVVNAPVPVVTILSPSTNANLVVTGGVLFEMLRVLDRINSYEIRSGEINETGLFPLNRMGRFWLTVTSADGCKRTVEGIITNQP